MNLIAKDNLRDRYIDIARGVCIISLVHLHTAFWSGNFLPTWWQSVTLLLDVPAFFFIAGMTFAVTQRESILSSIFRFSTIYGLIVFIYDLIFSHFNFTNTIDALLLTPPNLKLLPVVLGSYWFVNNYIVTLIFGTLIIKKMKPLTCFFIIGFLSYYALCFFSGQGTNDHAVLGVSTNCLFFYTSLFLLGYIIREKIIDTKYKNFIALIIFITGILLYFIAYLKFGNTVLNLQTNKLIVKLPYIAASLPSIALIILFYQKTCKNFLLEHIGKNAIFYYVGQSVAITIVYELVIWHTELWYYKFLLFFFLNMVVTIIVAELIRLLYTNIGKLISLILKKINYLI